MPIQPAQQKTNFFAAIVDHIGSKVSYPPIPCDGAAHAADIILERLSPRTAAI